MANRLNFNEWVAKRELQENDAHAYKQISDGPEVVNIINYPNNGVYLMLASGKKIGPVSDIKAAQGDKTHSRWIVTTDKGSHGVMINPELAPKIVSSFYDFQKQHDGSGMAKGLMHSLGIQADRAKSPTNRQ